MARKSVFVIFSSLITIIILAVVEQVLDVNYIWKTAAKIGLFFLVIWTFKRFCNSKFSWREFVSLKIMGPGEWLRVVGLGLASASLVFVAFLITRPYIDMSMIKADLVGRLGISGSTFLLVGAYITFVNSLLEEYFFRGYIFFNLPRKWGYVYSPLLFAIYHIPMIISWFGPVIILICFFGLWAIGLIFQWVNEKNKTIWASWMIHMCADVVIILIGCTLFF